ncbi:MAG: hypothetical protein Q9157_005644 [Trypethelium eluteriae]
MRDTIRDSFVGHIIHSLSGGRLLGWEEDYNNEMVAKLVQTGSNAGNPVALEEMTNRGPSIEINGQKQLREQPSMASTTFDGQTLRAKPSMASSFQQPVHEPGKPLREMPSMASSFQPDGQRPLKEMPSYATGLSHKPLISQPSDVEARLESQKPIEELREEPIDSTRPSAEPEEMEKGQDYELIDWLPNDPANPRNWSIGKKFFVTFEICFLTMSVYIGSAIYTAGLEYVILEYHVSETAALLGLTLFVIGYAVGPMLWSSMSEVPYFGRTNIYILTLIVFVFFQFGVIYAKNFGMLLAFRFLTGVFGSPVLATGGATVADMYVPRKQVYAMAMWGSSAVFGPALGPLVGGFAAENKGWRWTIWELLWLSGFCLVFIMIFLPETSASNILFRRADRLRKRTGNTKLKTKGEVMAEQMTGHEAMMMVLVRPFTLSFFEPIVLILNLYIALVYSLLYLWFESFPLVFVDIYHFNTGTNGLAFLGLLVGSWIALPIFFWWVHKYLEPKFNANGELKPEYRIMPAMVGAFFIPACLFWFGWSARPSVHWIVPIIGSSLFSMGALCLFMSVLSYLGDAYPDYVASVYAGNDLFRSGVAAAFPLFANHMYKVLGLGWGSSTLAFIGIAFIPIPFVLYRYGERIRRMSKMARHDF